MRKATTSITTRGIMGKKPAAQSVTYNNKPVTPSDSTSTYRRNCCVLPCVWGISCFGSRAKGFSFPLRNSK